MLLVVYSFWGRFILSEQHEGGSHLEDSHQLTLYYAVQSAERKDS